VTEEVFPSLNAAADAYYFETVMRRQLEEKKQSFLKRIRALLGRLERRKENLLLDRGKFEEDLALKSYGDLLVAHFRELKKGLKEIEVRDHGADPPVSVLIPLDEALDPAGNVDRVFRKYKKAKRGIEMVTGRLGETQKEMEYLESAYFQIEAAEDAEDLEAVREELEGERILPAPRQRKPGRKKEEPALPVRRFRSSDGLEIFCGKSNLGNDYLLRNLARGNDLWFHAQGFPGSHVLLKTGPGEPKFESVAEAATIAAFFSRGKGSTRVPVDYTPARNVHRPKGARPGLVTILHQKTLWVVPDREKVEKLKI
jgi:predicted ribosome quality control (RQC) complex YloA/Tae2 family protein